MTEEEVLRLDKYVCAALAGLLASPTSAYSRQIRDGAPVSPGLVEQTMTDMAREAVALGTKAFQVLDGVLIQTYADEQARQMEVAARAKADDLAQELAKSVAAGAPVEELDRLDAAYARADAAAGGRQDDRLNFYGAGQGPATIEAGVGA